MEEHKEEDEPYIRKYMREHYLANTEKMKQYRKSCRLRQKCNIHEDEWKKYGEHLADIMKLREIVNRLPQKFLLEVITPQQETQTI
jgi:hypothetical protein